MLSMPGLYQTKLLVYGHSSTGMQGPAPFQPPCQDLHISMLNKPQDYLSSPAFFSRQNASHLPT